SRSRRCANTASLVLNSAQANARRQCLNGMDPVSTPADHSPPPPKAPEGADLVDLADPASGDRISVTDVHGTVARFEMAYSPVEGDKFSFGPPLYQRIPPLF